MSAVRVADYLAKRDRNLARVAELQAVLDKAERKAMEALDHLSDADFTTMKPPDINKWFIAFDRARKSIDSMIQTKCKEAADDDWRAGVTEAFPDLFPPPAATATPDPTSHPTDETSTPNPTVSPATKKLIADAQAECAANRERHATAESKNAPPFDAAADFRQVLERIRPSKPAKRNGRSAKTPSY